VGDGAGRELLASQRARRFRGRLRLLRSHPRGSFRELDAIGTVRRGRLRITTSHRFRHGSIDERWAVRCGGGCAARSVEVHLPTRAGSTIEGVLRDGSRVALDAPRPLADVARLELGGYSATPTHAPPGAVVAAVATKPQRTAPAPGPTLAIRLARVSAPTLGLRLAPERENVTAD
jgi:hypothetical protein